MGPSPRQAPDLERALLARGVGALRDGRARCADCDRTPLVGERVHVYEGELIVCALCRPQRSEPPLRSESVRGAEHGHAVRPARPLETADQRFAA